MPVGDDEQIRTEESPSGRSNEQFAKVLPALFVIKDICEGGGGGIERERRRRKMGRIGLGNETQ